MSQHKFPYLWGNEEQSTYQSYFYHLYNSAYTIKFYTKIRNKTQKGKCNSEIFYIIFGVGYILIKDIMEKKKKCTTCQNYFSKHWLLMLAAFYMLFSSIYGTIELVKVISSSLGR